MKIITAEDYAELSRTAAEAVVHAVRNNPQIRLGLATGGTPIGMYREMVADWRRNGTSYRKAVAFNLDEYMGLPQDHPNSYHQYMQSYLFQYVDIPQRNIHIPNGEAPNAEAECERYERSIGAAGGIDLQVLGIGRNGHIGFNEPGTSFHSGVHVVTLAEPTRQANARFFKSADEVPEQAITAGIATIMKSKQILLLVSGEEKREACARLIHGNVDEQFPASVLKRHPDVTMIVDRAAACEMHESWKSV